MGKLIVIEGTKCSGKETQSLMLEKRLKELGFKCVRLSFPMYDTPTGKIVGGCYLGKEEIGVTFFEEGVSNVDPKIAALYYAADRKYNIHKVLEYIEEDYFVILDRYITSSLAYQGSKIKDKEERFNTYQWIDKLEYWLLSLPKPDMTIYLHVPYEYSKELMSNRKTFADLDEEQIRCTEMCYIELTQLYNWNYINCIKDQKIREIEDINNELLNLILQENRKGKA